MEVTKVQRAVQARVGRWPFEPDVAHLVLLDHQMVPSKTDVDEWVRQARASGMRAIRTGALFSSSVGPFLDCGFVTVDRLALLEARLDPDAPSDARTPNTGGHAARTRPLRAHRLGEAAAIDQRAFTSPWGNDRAALTDILRATPACRGRVVTLNRRMKGFAITGVANRIGYLQRLAVDPDTQRRGYGSALVADSLDWMSRRGAGTAMVNTAFDNTAALTLYERFGFRRRDDSLSILELALRDTG